MLLATPALALALTLPTPTPPGNNVGAALSRRAMLAQPFSVAAALALAPLAAVADVRGANQDVPRDQKGVNKLLSSYGFSEMKVPGGFTPLVQYIGTAPPANIDGIKARERSFKSTLLVRFLYPNGWLVESPSIDENGEAGNIGANDFIKGDGCTFSSLPLPGGKNIETLVKDKEFFKNWLTSQMSKDVFEDVKVKKIKPDTKADGTETLKIDFTYTLLTRAGFTVLRRGVASASITNGAVVGVVLATTELRWKEMSEKYDVMADSFRAYPVKTPVFQNEVDQF